MPMPRKLSLTLLALVALTWALVLCVGGLWLAVIAPGLVEPGTEMLARVGGVTAIAGGMLVFVICIADRVFPRASRRLTWSMEIPTCITMFAGFGYLAIAGVRVLAAGA